MAAENQSNQSRKMKQTNPDHKKKREKQQYQFLPLPENSKEKAESDKAGGDERAWSLLYAYPQLYRSPRQWKWNESMETVKSNGGGNGMQELRIQER